MSADQKIINKMIHLYPIIKLEIWWDRTQYKDQSREKFLLSNKKEEKVKIAQLHQPILV